MMIHKIKSNRKFALISIILIVFIDSIGFGMIFPLLPALFTVKNSGIIISKPFMDVNILYGFALSLYPLASFIGMPVLGRLSDIFGRKALLLCGLVIILFGYFLSAISINSHSLCLFYLSRMICGFGAGTYSICSAIMLDYSKNMDDKFFGLKNLTLATILGFLIGPSLSYFLYESNDISMAVPFCIASGLCILNILLLYVFFQDSAASHDFKGSKITTEINESIKFIFSNTSIRYLMLGYLFFNLGFELFLQSQSLYLKNAYLYSVKQTGLFFVIMGISFAIGMYFLHPILNKFFNIIKQIRVGICLMGYCLVAYSFMIVNIIDDNNFQLIMTWLNSMLFYLITPIITLNMTKHFSDIVSSNLQGNLMGALGQISSMATIFGALFMGLIASILPNYNSAFAGILIIMGGFIIKDFMDSRKI